MATNDTRTYTLHDHIETVIIKSVTCAIGGVLLIGATAIVDPLIGLGMVLLVGLTLLYLHVRIILKEVMYMIHDPPQQ